MAAQALHGVLLAAGGSSRFRASKQLAQYRGRSLLRHAATTAAEALGPGVHVVLGADADAARAELDGLDVRIVVHAHWREGLASSLKAGIRALPHTCGAALIMLCDQPRVDAGTLRRLLAAWSLAPQRLIACGYAGTLGAPAIVPRPFFPEVYALTGDRGAKALLQRHREETICVPAPEAALDVDTPADLPAP